MKKSLYGILAIFIAVVISILTPLVFLLTLVTGDTNIAIDAVPLLLTGYLLSPFYDVLTANAGEFIYE